MTHEPLHPPVTFQELPSLGLRSLPENNTPTRLQRKTSCCLLACVTVTRNFMNEMSPKYTKQE